MKKGKEESMYNNPILENYMCDGQITIQEWLEKKENKKESK